MIFDEDKLRSLCIVEGRRMHHHRRGLAEGLATTTTITVTRNGSLRRNHFIELFLHFVGHGAVPTVDDDAGSRSSYHVIGKSNEHVHKILTICALSCVLSFPHSHKIIIEYHCHYDL